MGYVRFLLSLTAVSVFSACAGYNRLGSNNLGAGIDPNSASTVASHTVPGSMMSKSTPLATARPVAKITAVSPADKLIALTFDDGPRPYVLFGSKTVHQASGLVDILDQNGVKATFFVVGWRLTPKTWGEPRHEENIGVTCLDAAEQLIRRGHEL